MGTKRTSQRQFVANADGRKEQMFIIYHVTEELCEGVAKAGTAAYELHPWLNKICVV